MGIKHFQHQKFSHNPLDDRQAVFIEADSNEEAKEISNWCNNNLTKIVEYASDEPSMNRLWIYMANLEDLTLFKLTWVYGD